MVLFTLVHFPLILVAAVAVLPLNTSTGVVLELHTAIGESPEISGNSTR